jgi:hypothetical protein
MAHSIKGPFATPLRGRARLRTALVVATVSAVIYLLFVVVDAGRLGLVHNLDTDNLVAGTHKAIQCIRDGQLHACGRIPGGSQTTVFPYPLLQYLPASIFVALPMSDSAIDEGLARLSTVAFAMCLALIVYCFRRQPARAIVGVSVLLASSATYQATTGLGEMLSATVVLAAVVASHERRHRLLTAILVALACTGKETLLPFVVVLCLLAARRPSDGLLPPRKETLDIGLGATVGAAAGAAFNVFRFGTFRNVEYLDPLFRTPGVARKLEWWAGTWLSPTAGIWLFWPLITILLFLMIIIASRHVFHRDGWKSWLPPLAVVLTTTTFTAGLALWYTPFGWITYGPRLAVPLLPAIAVTALLVSGEEVIAALRRMGRSGLGCAGVVAVVAIAAWPQLGAPWRHTYAVNDLMRPDEYCPNPPLLQTDVNGYYRCASHETWRLRPFVLGRTLWGGSPISYVARVVGVVTVGLGYVWIARARCGDLIERDAHPPGQAEPRSPVAAVGRDHGQENRSTR